MLLSTCPNCNARFRVAPEQLNVRQGHVMCGRCRHVFNAFESLKRVEDEPATETIDYSIVAGKNSADETSLSATTNSPPELDVADGVRESPAVENAAVVKTVPDTYIDENIDSAADTKDHVPISAHAFATTADTAIPADHDRAAQQAPDVAEVRADGRDTVEPRISEQDSPDTTPNVVAIPESFRPPKENPLIAGALPQQRPASTAWRWLAAAAAVALIAQMTLVYVGWIFQQVPQARPAFTAVCDLVGCVVPLARDVGAIKVESSNLIEQPGKPGRILLSAIVANRSAVKQSFPVLQIVLTDPKETVIASRVLQPSAYLGRAPGPTEGIAPNTELYINLNLDLMAGFAASGYAVSVFYP